MRLPKCLLTQTAFTEMSLSFNRILKTATAPACASNSAYAARLSCSEPAVQTLKTSPVSLPPATSPSARPDAGSAADFGDYTILITVTDKLIAWGLS